MKTILCVFFVLFTSLSYGQDGWIECENMDSAAIPHALAISIRHMEISIDGVASETFWGNAQAYPIEISLKDQAPADANDFSGSYKLAWDSVFLYACIEIIDDSLVTYDVRSDCKTWQNDCVEFFINPDGRTNGSCPDKNGLDDGSEIHANPGDDEVIQNNLAGMGYHNTVADISGYRYQSTETETGFIMEVQMPWYMMSDSLQTLMRSDASRPAVSFGFDVNYCDADDAGETCKDLREHIMSWASDKSSNFRNTSRYGIVKLEGSEIMENTTLLNNIENIKKVTDSGKDLLIETNGTIDSIFVFSLTGKQVFSSTKIQSRQVQLSKSYFKEGIYVLQLVMADSNLISLKYKF